MLSTRDSQCECGREAKGALDRPSPIRVLSGVRLTRAQAKKATMEELVKFIKEKVDASSYADIELSSLSEEAEEAEFNKILSTEIGEPITDVKKRAQEENREQQLFEL